MINLYLYHTVYLSHLKIYLLSAKMFPVLIKKRFTKHYFAIFLCFSVLAHLGIIASSPKIRRVLPGLSKTISLNNSGEMTTIEFVLNDSPLTGYEIKNKTIDIIDEIADDDSELEEKKRQLFVDTSQLQSDEESSADSDKIGEKGSIARDNKPNNNDVNEDGFSDGESEILSIVKGVQTIVSAGSNEVYVPETIKEEEKNESEPRDPMENKLQELNNKKEITGLRKSLIDEMQENHDDLTEQTEGKNQNDGIEQTAELLEDLVNEQEDNNNSENKKTSEQAAAAAATNQYQNEEPRTLDSEFERIIPEPAETQINKQKKEIKNKESEQSTVGKFQSEPKMEKLTGLTKEEKDKFLREIYEVYEKDINSQNNEFKPKPKVAMSVNGKGVYNVPAPSYKADLSNATLMGEASFNIKKNEYASYYKHIRDKISLYWMLYFGTDQSIKFTTKDGLPVIIEFKVNPSGKIIDVSIADDGGNPFLASRTHASVTKTELDAFPSFIKEKYIDVRFNFYFF